MSGFILDGIRYEWVPLADILVREQIQVEHWLNHDGRQYTDARTWDDVVAISREVNDLGDYAEQQKHPDFKFALSMTIWLAKLRAGERLTIGESFGAWNWDDLFFWSDEEEAEGKGDAAP